MPNPVPGINEAIIKQFPPRPGRRPNLPPLSERAQVALTCRMLIKEGWNDHIDGLINYRPVTYTHLLSHDTS